MEQSEQINELAAALAKAQGEMKNVKKTSENPFYHSTYAELDAVWDSVRPVLSKHGLSVIQGTGQNDGDVHVTTMLLHSSGQWIRSTLTLPIGEKHTAQAVGTAITYGRRYSLSAMVGIASEEDTDAQDIAEPAKKKAEPKSPPVKAMHHIIPDLQKAGAQVVVDLYEAKAITDDEAKTMSEFFKTESRGPVLDKALHKARDKYLSAINTTQEGEDVKQPDILYPG